MNVLSRCSGRDLNLEVHPGVSFHILKVKSQIGWGQIPVLPVAKFVMLSKLLNLLCFHFLSCEMRVIIIAYLVGLF